MPTKVLHVIPSIGPARGGPSFVVRTMAKYQAGLGLAVHVATTDDNGPLQRIEPESVPVQQDNVTYWIFPRQTRFYTFSFPLTVWLRKHIADYDVVHIHALFSYSSLVAALFAALAGVPYMVRPLGVLGRWGMQNRRRGLKELSFNLIERRIIRHAALVHYTSQQEAQEARELKAGERQIVIANPVYAPPTATKGTFRASHPELGYRKIILFFSRLDQKKGLDLLLDSYSRLRMRRANIALVVAGDGDAEFVMGLKQQAHALEIESDVVWAGFLEGKEKAAALADSDVFALPSYSENFGVAVVEAMNAGLPVIVSDQVGIHHEISAANAGLVVRCDSAQLEAALERLIEDAALRESLGKNAQQLARQFAPEVITKQLIETYARICNKCGEPVAA